MAIVIPICWLPYVTERIDMRNIIYKATDFNLADKRTYQPKIVNAFILETLQYYTSKRLHNDELWAHFQHDFRGWSADLFNIAAHKVRAELRDHLRFGGVFVDNKIRVDYALDDTLCEVERRHWTPEEIGMALDEGELIYYLP